MSEPSRRRVTYSQLEHLWEFLNRRRDLAMGYNKSAQAREFSRRMWEQVALNLNSHGDGAVKDWKGWCKYWNDYKSKLKKLAAATRSSLQMTGGGQSTVKPMTEIEKKFLLLLGTDFGCGLPGIRVQPFEDEPQSERSINIVQISSGPLALEDSPQLDGSESILTGMNLASIPVIIDASSPGPSQQIPSPTPGPSRLVTPPPAPLTPPPASSTPSQIFSPRRSPRRHHTRAPPTTPPLSISPHHRSPRHQPSTTPASMPVRQQFAATTPPRPPQRRRRARREPPVTAEGARRALILEAQHQTRVEEAKLELFRIIIQELRDIKQIFQSRFPQTRDGE